MNSPGRHPHKDPNLYMYIYVYIYIYCVVTPPNPHLYLKTYTDTHTHIYIYMYNMCLAIPLGPRSIWPSHGALQRHDARGRAGARFLRQRAVRQGGHLVHPGEFQANA